MAVVIGNGIGNLGVWGVLSGTFTVTSFSDTGFTATSGFATVTASGFGLTYASSPGPGGTTLVATTGGTVTGVSYSSGSSQQSWTGVSVPGASASNAIASGTMTNFNNLFFSGDDTFNFVAGTNTALYGYDGNDVFNVSGWNGSTSVDGGNGNDVLNITGGVNPGFSPNFNVTNVETIRLGAGADYTLFVQPNFISTIDGSALGPLNHLFFAGGNYFGGSPSNVTVIGGAGNDTFQPATGVNVFNGGGGINTLDLTNTGTGGSPDTVNLGITRPQALGNNTSDILTLSNIQNIIGRSGADILTGDNGDNVIDGRGGGDTINGGGGNDTIIIGSQFGFGNDAATIDGGPGTDTVVFMGPLSSYTIGQSGGAITFTNAHVDSLTNVEYAQFSDQTIALSGPLLTTGTVAAVRNQTLPLSSLFSVTDVLGFPVTEYQMWDNTPNPLSGSFVVNGVVQAAQTVIDISAAQLSQVSFVTGRLSDDLQIRAFDGTYWSSPDHAAWAPFTVSVPNHAPALLTSNTTITHGQSVAASSLFTVSDADGDPITEYQVWDSVDDPYTGHFVVNGVVQQGRTVIDITAAQLAQTTYVAGGAGENLQIRAFDGIDWSAPASGAWSPFTISVPANRAPVVFTTSQATQHGHTFALSGLMSVSDADGDPITEYQLWDSVDDPSTGHFVVNGVAQQGRTVIDITAAQLAQTSYVAGAVGENLQIRAFDGFDWSAPGSGAWSPFTISVPANHAPVLLTTSTTIPHGQSVTASSLFSISDADGDPITAYEIWDSVNDPSSGHFVVNGVVQPERTVIDITAAQLAQTTYVAGAVGENLQIRAFDGFDWSAPASGAWSPFTISVPANHAPVVATTSQATQHGHTFALSSLMSVSDADGDPITEYQVWDSVDDPYTGHFVVNGVVQQGRTVIDITAAQLAQTTYVAGGAGENLQIRAFDGFDWSAPASGAWSPFTISVPPNHAPVLLTTSQATQHGHTFALSGLMSVSDADGDPITEYQLWDSVDDPSTGHFVVNGVVQQGRTVIDITAAQLAQTSYVAGAVGENLQIRAFDGFDWSAPGSGAWSPFTISVPANHAPVLLTTSTTIPHGQSVAASSLFSVSDADGDPITEYQLWDSVDDPSSGHFVVNGVVQPERTVIDITAAQLAQTTYVAGAVGVGENLQIRAFDGFDWSAPASGAWAPFHISVN